jgi:hypothetical protein
LLQILFHFLYSRQGCQMVFFQTKNPFLGIFWRSLKYTMLANFVAIRNILQPFGTLHGHSVYYEVIW